MARFKDETQEWKRRALKAEARVAHMQGQNDIEDVFRYLADAGGSFEREPTTAYLQGIIDGCWEAHLTMKRARAAVAACMRLADAVMARKDEVEEEIETEMDAAEIGMQVTRINLNKANKNDEPWPTHAGDTPEEREQTRKDADTVSDYLIEKGEGFGGTADHGIEIAKGTGLPIERVHRAVWLITNDIDAHEAEYGKDDEDAEGT